MFILGAHNIRYYSEPFALYIYIPLYIVYMGSWFGYLLLWQSQNSIFFSHFHFHSGILLISAGQTDIAGARALSHEDDIIQIYSNSWGPFDFGYIVDGPDILASRTFEQQARLVT